VENGRLEQERNKKGKKEMKHNLSNNMNIQFVDVRNKSQYNRNEMFRYVKYS